MGKKILFSCIVMLVIVTMGITKAEAKEDVTDFENVVKETVSDELGKDIDKDNVIINIENLNIEGDSKINIDNIENIENFNYIENETVIEPTPVVVKTSATKSDAQEIQAPEEVPDKLVEYLPKICFFIAAMAIILILPTIIMKIVRGY